MGELAKASNINVVISFVLPAYDFPCGQKSLTSFLNKKNN
jgi:hypothetical protein